MLKLFQSYLPWSVVSQIFQLLLKMFARIAMFITFFSKGKLFMRKKKIKIETNICQSAFLMFWKSNAPLLDTKLFFLLF